MIEQIKQALEKATPGPWNKEGTEIWRRGESYESLTFPHVWVADVVKTENANLIANAPAYLCYLLNKIERKDKALQEVREAVWDEVVPSKIAAKVNRIVEEGLK